MAAAVTGAIMPVRMAVLRWSRIASATCRVVRSMLGPEQRPDPRQGYGRQQRHQGQHHQQLEQREAALSCPSS